MSRVTFTQNLQRHVASPATQVAGGTLRQVLDRVFADNPQLKGYVLDDQGGLRKHMQIFIAGEMVSDRVGLSDEVPEDAEIYVAQALSGG